jgi:hypothetical protein
MLGNYQVAKQLGISRAVLSSMELVTKSKRMRWVGHVARMGEKRNAYRVLVGKPERKGHWEDQDVGGWIKLGWIL